MTQNSVLYTKMIYKRHVENITKANNGEGRDGGEIEEQVNSPLSLLASVDELDQVLPIDSSFRTENERTCSHPVLLFIIIFHYIYKGVHDSK